MESTSVKPIDENDASMILRKVDPKRPSPVREIEQEELERASAVFEVMNQVIPEDILPTPDQYTNIIEAVRQKLK